MPALPAPDPEPAPPRAPTRTGGVSPGRGTKTCSPSATSRARFEPLHVRTGQRTTGGGQHVDDPGPVRDRHHPGSGHLPNDIDDDEPPRGATSRRPRGLRRVDARRPAAGARAVRPRRPRRPRGSGRLRSPAVAPDANAVGTDPRATRPSPVGTDWGTAACCARATRTAKNTTATTSTRTNATTARTDTATRAPRNATGTVSTRGGGRCLPSPAEPEPEPGRRTVARRRASTFRASARLQRPLVQPRQVGRLDRRGRLLGNPPARSRRRGSGPRRRQQGAQAVGVDLGWWAATHTSDRRNRSPRRRHPTADLWTAGRTAQSLWITRAAATRPPPACRDRRGRPRPRRARPPRRAPPAEHARAATPRAPPRRLAESRCCTAMSTSPPAAITSLAAAAVSSVNRASARLDVRTFSSGTMAPSTEVRMRLDGERRPEQRRRRPDPTAASQVLQGVDVERHLRPDCPDARDLGHLRHRQTVAGRLRRRQHPEPHRHPQ